MVIFRAKVNDLICKFFNGLEDIEDYANNNNLDPETAKHYTITKLKRGLGQ